MTDSLNIDRYGGLLLQLPPNYGKLSPELAQRYTCASGFKSKIQHLDFKWGGRQSTVLPSSFLPVCGDRYLDVFQVDLEAG